MPNVTPIAFVFRPNGVPGGNVFVDWPSLMSALRPADRRLQIEGRKVIEFDDSLTADAGCVIPGSTSSYDMTDVVWAGFGPRPGASRSSVVIADGATFKGLRMIGGQITIDNQAKEVSPIADFIEGNAGSNHVQIGMRDDSGNTQIFNSGAAPLFDLGTPANPDVEKSVFFFIQNALFGIRVNPGRRGTSLPNPLITHTNVSCSLNFIGQSQTGDNILKSPAKAYFSPLSSSALIGAYNIEDAGNEFSPVTRIQRKVQPQPPALPATSMAEIGEISLPNVLLRCDGRVAKKPKKRWWPIILLWPFGGTGGGALQSGFEVVLPNIRNGFTFAGLDKTTLYTGGQEIVVAEVAGGVVGVSASEGDTIDGSDAPVFVLAHGSRVFSSDGHDNWITIASHQP